MNYEDLKIKDSEMSTLGVVAAPDRLTGTAQENKAVFDRLIKAVMAKKFNSFLDQFQEEFESLREEVEENENISVEEISKLIEKYLEENPQYADWAEWNENSGGYVKNRTHYKQVIYPHAMLLDNVSLDFKLEMVELAGLGTDDVAEGVDYTVTWNGAKYKCKAYIYGGSVCLGNSSLMGGSGNTGEPFVFEMMGPDRCLVMKNSSAATSITISVERHEFVELKKLDAEFLPDNLLAVESAEVGQVAAVEAVDENGKPIKWKVIDLSAIDGKDGYSPTVAVSDISGGHRIAITDAGGTKTVDVMDGQKGDTGPQGEKGSTGATGAAGKDGVSATHEWNGTVLKVTSASGTSSANLKGEKGDPGKDGADGVTPVITVQAESLPAGNDATVQDLGRTDRPHFVFGIPRGEKGEKGEKGDKGDSTVASWNDLSAPMPVRFLPEGVPYVDEDFVELLPETELTGRQQGDEIYGYMYDPPFMLSAGENYTVVWNGVSYETVGVTPYGYEHVQIGNATKHGGEENGLPFAISQYEAHAVEAKESVLFVYPFDGSTTFTFSIYKGGSHKLDPWLLPDSVGTVKSVNGVTPDANGNVQIQAGGGGAGIIDVAELPTENINNSALYRVPRAATFVSSGFLMGGTVHIVNGLPETGEPMTTDGASISTGYFNVQDGEVYGYVPDYIAANFGIPGGWYTFTQLAPIAGVVWFGTVGSLRDCPMDLSSASLGAMVEYDLWQHKYSWNILGKTFTVVIDADDKGYAKADKTYYEIQAAARDTNTHVRAVVRRHLNDMDDPNDVLVTEFAELTYMWGDIYFYTMGNKSNQTMITVSTSGVTLTSQ